MKHRKKIAVALMIAMGLILVGTMSLSDLKTEASRRLKAVNSISIQENTSNIKSVGLNIKLDDGTKSNDVKMYAGETATLVATVTPEDSSQTYTKGVTYTYSPENGLTSAGIFSSKYFTVGDVPAGTVITFTATAKGDASKTATAKVTVVEKPTLNSITIEAPEGYTVQKGAGENGIDVVEVPLGTTELTLKGNADYSEGYAWNPSWKANWTLDKNEQQKETDTIKIDESTGKVTILDTAEEGDHAVINLQQKGDETDNRKKGAIIIKIVNTNTSNIKSVGLNIKLDDGTKSNDVKMYAGETATLVATVTPEDSSQTYTKGVTYTYSPENGLTSAGIFSSKYFTVGDVPAGTVITFTATAKGDASKTATAKVTVVEKPTLNSITIEAPEGYTVQKGAGENGIDVVEVPLGTTELTLKGNADYSEGYAWNPSWKANWTLDKNEQQKETDTIKIDESTGKVTILDTAEEGDHAVINLQQKGDETDNRKKGAIIIKIVKKKSSETGILRGISITAPNGYEINQGVIEVYPGTNFVLNGVPDKTEDYVWTPSWKVGPTFDASEEQKKTSRISINEDTGEVAVSSYAGDGDYADITLTQKNDDSGIHATVRIKVKYWNITVDTEPSGLTNTKEKVDPTRARKDETISFNSTYRGAVDAAGQKYIFSHWKTDEANKELMSLNYGTVNGCTVGNYFKMPERDVHLTAVFEKSWQVNEKAIGGGNVPNFLNGAADYPEGEKVKTYIYKAQLEGRHLVVQDVKVVKANGEEIPSETKEETTGSVNTLAIYFTMPAEEVTVELTLVRDTDADKKLTLGEVTGSLINGIAGTASVEVTVSGYTDGEVLTVGESYSEGTLKEESDRTAGLSFTVSSVTGGKAQVTIQTDRAVPAGTYSFAVVASDGKAKATGKVTVHEAEAKSLTVKGASIELEEDATGELSLKGTSLNLQNGTAVKAIETDAKGTEKTFGKTEGLAFDDTTIADNAFTMKAHLSKTVAAGTYYFKVQAGDTVSEVASIVVTRTKKEEPEPTPPVEEKEYSINASCNSNQGSIEIRVNGTEATKAKKGDKVTLTAVPKSGYKLKNWSLNMDMTTITPSEGALTDTTISFLMPEGTVTVGAAFESTSTENPDTPTSVAPTITAFVVANVNGVIDQSTGQITVVVPNGTDVTALKPAVAVSDGATVTPSSGATVNFTDAVVYTVKSASGETKQYVVTVKVQEASVSDSLWDQITNPEGDRSWWKKADSIKSHKKNKYPKYW